MPFDLCRQTQSLDNTKQPGKAKPKKNDNFSKEEGADFRKRLLEEISKEVIEDLQNLNGLLEKQEKKKTKLDDFESTLKNTSKATTEKEFHRNDYLKEVKDAQAMAQIATLSQKVSFECHLEILKSSLFLGHSELFLSLLELAIKRANLFNFEKPYISDIQFLETEDVEPVVNKMYSLIPIDLNEPHLLQLIEEIRGKFGIQNLEMAPEG